MYRELCAAAGVKPGDIRSLDDVRRLPFLEKTTLRDTYPDGLRTCGLDKIIEVHSTSGTTGKPTPIWASRHDMEAWATRNARTMWMVGLRPGDLLQNCFGYGLPTSVGLQYGAQRAGIGVVPAGIGRQELLIDLIVDLGVTALCTTPSYALYLADKALERGIDRRRLQAARRPVRRRALARVRPRPAHRRARRRRLQRVRHGRVPRARGWPPSAPSRTACTCGPTTCSWSASTRRRCEPVADGDPGELVWTSLTSDSMAMIRYRSHDICSLTWEPCACGRTHPRIGRITGRSDDALSIGGLVVFPSQVEEVLRAASTSSATTSAWSWRT